jgi:AbrB family looped-hinge helix DNA binding protein
MRSIAARVTSKGQITIPLEVRKRLGLRAGDSVVFRLEDNAGRGAAMEPAGGGAQAAVDRIPELVALAGTMPGPADRRARSWAEIRDAAWDSELAHRR